MSLIDILIAKQKERGLSDGDMARLLGISRPYWYYSQQERRISTRVLRGVMRAFPELAAQVLEYLQREEDCVLSQPA